MKDGIKAHQFYSWMNIRWLHCNQEKRIFRFEVSASSTKSFIFFFSFQRFFPQNNRIWCLFLTRNFSVDSLSCKINFLSPNFEKKKQCSVRGNSYLHLVFQENAKLCFLWDSQPSSSCEAVGMAMVISLFFFCMAWSLPRFQQKNLLQFLE